MTVRITFCAPPRQNSPDGSPFQMSVVHERRLEGVPPQVAQEMDDDYIRYQSNRAGASRYNIYRFESAGEQMEVALDFREITALDISTS